jgi:hypothetical protein
MKKVANKKTAKVVPKKQVPDKAPAKTTFKEWTEAVRKARASMENTYPEEFKGKFIPLRKESKPPQGLNKAEQRKYELGHMFYLKAKKMDCDN